MAPSELRFMGDGDYVTLKVAVCIRVSVNLLAARQRFLADAQLEHRLARVLDQLVDGVRPGRIGGGADPCPDAEPRYRRARVQQPIDHELVQFSACDDIHVLAAPPRPAWRARGEIEFNRSPLSSRTAPSRCPASFISSATVIAFRAPSMGS